MDTKIYFTQVWVIEPGTGNVMEVWRMDLGQRILKVQGDSQQIADCLTKIMTLQAAHRGALESWL